MSLSQSVFNLVECIAEERLGLSKEEFDNIFEGNLEELFFDAAEEGNIGLMIYLVRYQKVNVNARDVAGKTALMYAASGGYLKIMDFLIQNGANINARSDDNKSVLMYAAIGGHLDVIKYLVEEKKVNITEKNNADMTAFIWAAAYGHLEIVKYFVEKKKVDINAKGGIYGWTALIFAAHGGYKDVMDFLVKHGANINAKGSNGTTALIEAAANGHLNAVEYLLDEVKDQKVNINVIDWMGMTALMHASQRGYLKIVNLLIKNGANASINTRDNNFNWTALLWAIKGEYLEIAEILIKNGSDITIKGKFKKNALDYAKEEDNTKIKELLEKVYSFFEFIEYGKTEEINQMLEKDSWLIKTCKDGKIAGDLIEEKGLSVKVSKLDGIMLDDKIPEPKVSAKTRKKPETPNKKKQTS